MRLLQTLVPWIIFLASTLSFVLGWTWDMKGMLIQNYLPNDWESRAIGHAISNVGNIFECFSFIGFLIGIALFGAQLQLKESEKRVRRLEEGVDWLRRALPPLSMAPPRSDGGESSDVSLP